MKKKIAILSIIASCLLTGCCPKERTVEFPAVDAPNTTSAIIEKVELTDSVTNVHIRGYHRPKWWIRIVPETYLIADGKKYEIIGSEGIELGKELYMPADGDSLFTLKFAPLPLRTKSFDLIEGDEEGSWRFVGINLTEKPSTPYDNGLPKHVKITPETTAEIPEFSYEIGESTINVHYLGYNPSFGNVPELHMGNILGIPFVHKLKVDPATGAASISFKQYGTMSGYFYLNYTQMGNFRIAPGETVDVYVDLSYMDYMTATRNKTDKKVGHIKPLYTDGSIYDCINNIPYEYDPWKMNMKTGYPDKEKYSLSADEITDGIIGEYEDMVREVQGKAWHPLAKAIKTVELKLSAMDAILHADGNRYYGYLMAHNKRPSDKVDFKPDPITEKHRNRLFDMIDLSDPLMLLTIKSSMLALLECDMNNASRYGNIRYLKPARAFYQMAENGNLTEDQLKDMRGWDEQMFYHMCNDLQNKALNDLAASKNLIQKTPDVPSDQLFEAIIAPHKGKVVLVDFWNTWCSPCRAALKANEPLKTGELAGKDIVWVYIANETSPIGKYVEMLPEIEGLHYRLNDEQWKQLTNKDFDIDGIPSYVLVKKDGSYSLRNDFRNHDKLVKTLKTELE